jgi:hypothetical protein
MTLANVVRDFPPPLDSWLGTPFVGAHASCGGLLNKQNNLGLLRTNYLCANGLQFLQRSSGAFHQ